MEHREFSFNVRIPWPTAKAGDASLTRFLPTPGNVIFTLLMIGLLLWASSAGALPLRLMGPNAPSTNTIAYQGRLADAGGAPLTGTYSIIFRLYSTTAGGVPLWEEQWTGTNGVRVSDGLFNVMLGSLTSIPQAVVTGNNTLWLGITVGTDNEMAPRVQLGSVPFAVQALTVPDGSVTTAKIADQAVTQAKLGPDVNLVPPDGSITTAKLADGAVTEPKLGVRLPRLLGQKTCDGCGQPIESNQFDWVPVKGANAQDIIEVTATTQGGAVMVLMTSRYSLNPVAEPWCGISVLQGSTQVRFAELEGTNARTGTDIGCSVSYVFADLPPGTYTFRAMGYVYPATQIKWWYQRQVAVFEY